MLLPRKCSPEESGSSSSGPAGRSPDHRYGGRFGTPWKRGSTGYVDGLVIVVEPGQRAMNTARQIKKLGEDLKIKNTMIVGNKVTSEEDRRLIEEQLSDFPILGYMSFNPKIIQADREGKSPYDIDEKIKEEVEAILKELEKRI